MNPSLICTFIGPPDAPRFSGSTDLTEDTPSDLTCDARNGFPAGGKIKWYNDGTFLEKGGTDVPNGDRFDIRDTLTLTPQRSDNGKKIKCEVEHETLTAAPYPSFETMIDVKCE